MDWAHPDNFFLMHFCQGKETSFKLLGYKAVIEVAEAAEASPSPGLSAGPGKAAPPKPGGNNPTVWTRPEIQYLVVRPLWILGKGFS